MGRESMHLAKSMRSMLRSRSCSYGRCTTGIDLPHPSFAARMSVATDRYQVSSRSESLSDLSSSDSQNRRSLRKAVGGMPNRPVRVGPDRSKSEGTYGSLAGCGASEWPTSIVTPKPPRSSDESDEEKVQEDLGEAVVEVLLDEGLDEYL